MAVETPTGVRRTALVVDDSDDQGDLLRLHLERLGYEVELVSTAEAAIGSYRELTPAVAIIDLLLPGIDGWQLVSMMKSDVPDCVLVVTSVLGLEEFPLVDGVLPKPFTARDVARVLGALFPQGQGQGQGQGANAPRRSGGEATR